MRRAGAKGDVGRQLKLLVRQRLFLKELVVPGGVFSLLGSLLNLTGGHLRRSARKGCVLSARAKGRHLRRCVRPHAVNALAQGRPLLRCRKALTEALLAQSGLLRCRSGTLTKLLFAQSSKLPRRSSALTKLLLTQRSKLPRCSGTLTKLLLAQSGLLRCRSSALTKLLFAQSSLLRCRGGTLTKLLLSQGGLRLRSASALTVNLLTKGGKVLTGGGSHAKKLLAQIALLLSGGKTLTEALLANAKRLLRGLLLCSAVCLCSPEAKLLLLLRGVKRLAKALIKNARKNLSVSQILLLVEVRRSNTRPVATKGPRANGVAHLPRLLLLVLLVEKASGALQNSAKIRGKILVDLISTQLIGVHCLRAAAHELSCNLLERLCAHQGLLRPVRRRPRQVLTLAKALRVLAAS